MPCDQIRTMTCTLEGANLEILKRALTRLGYNVTANARTGSLSAYHRESGDSLSYDGHRLRAPVGTDMNLIKRAYSRATVDSAAQRYGWRVNEKSPTRLTVERRGI